MGLGDKISNAAEEAKGKIKQGIGAMTDDEQLEAEGEADEARAEAAEAEAEAEQEADDNDDNA